MIIYATKQTRERYNLPEIKDMPNDLKTFNQAIIEKESGNELLEWGAKLFYFDSKKCLQLVNFASKFTLFLFDIKVKDVGDIANLMFEYIFDIYSDDEKMIECLNKMIKEHPFCTFSKLTNKSMISTLNTTETGFADYGNRFYSYIENGILKTKQINYDVNKDWIFTMKVNNKTEWFMSGEKFRNLVVEKYSK